MQSYRPNRFPRTKDKDLLYMVKVLQKYPPPPYNEMYDGAWDPTDGVVGGNLKLGEDKLREVCEKHALNPSGPRRKLLKRLYLHWRASTLREGEGYFGYGPGFMFTRKPTCACGFLNKEEAERRELQKQQIREGARQQKKRFSGVSRRLFPRLLFPRFPTIRYPRTNKFSRL